MDAIRPENRHDMSRMEGKLLGAEHSHCALRELLAFDHQTVEPICCPLLLVHNAESDGQAEHLASRLQDASDFESGLATELYGLVDLEE